MERKNSTRNLIAFWIFGLANNFAFVIMLSAAEDIIKGQTKTTNVNSANSNKTENLCRPILPKPRCDITSTGAILLADIMPAFIIKLICPFIIDRVPFGLRHFFVCITQALSFIIVAFSNTFTLSLIGVIFASLGGGLGENSLLALTAHYKRSTIAAWSSGTGGAGIVGSLAYAALTEPKLFALSPRNALLSMLIVPIVFALAYWMLLTPSPTVHRMHLLSPATWIVPKINQAEIADETLQIASELTFYTKIRQVIPLLRLMLPLGIVYFAEYLINSGLHQLLHFDCAHGFGLSEASQFRWYQTLYQLGVFISRSSVTLLELPTFVLYLLAVLQCANVLIVYFQTLFHYIPHIGIVFTVILVEGLFGGASYVNTFNKIHKKAPKALREFSLSIVAASDSLGVTIAGFVAILLHNHICILYERIYP